MHPFQSCPILNDTHLVRLSIVLQAIQYTYDIIGDGFVFVFCVSVVPAAIADVEFSRTVDLFKDGTFNLKFKSSGE